MKATLRSGAYTLPATDAPILNPAADGRKRNDWRAAGSFEPGRYFVTVRETEENFGGGDETITIRTINVRKLHGYGIDLGRRNVEDFAEFLDALVPDDTLDSLVRYAKIERYVDPVDVLVRLVEAGVVSDDAVRLAVHAQEQADAARYELEELRESVERGAA
ncbi:MAG: hypothetical protein ACW99F_20515 [Candidatus Hodarchaeales archaeon]|jgi:hypothetical protein